MLSNADGRESATPTEAAVGERESVGAKESGI